MKTIVITMFLSLTAQSWAYEGSLDVLRYAQAIIQDAKNQSFRPVTYFGGESVILLGDSTIYANISRGTLADQDDYISLDSAAYLLDGHGKALSVIIDFNILPYKVNYTYEISYNETSNTESRVAQVSVGGCVVSAISSFIGGELPVSVRIFANSEGNVTFTTDSTNTLIKTIVKDHWDSTGKGQLQETYNLYVQSAIFKYNINEYFS